MVIDIPDEIEAMLRAEWRASSDDFTDFTQWLTYSVKWKIIGEPTLKRMMAELASRREQIKRMLEIEGDELNKITLEETIEKINTSIQACTTRR